MNQFIAGGYFYFGETVQCPRKSLIWTSACIWVIDTEFKAIVKVYQKETVAEIRLFMIVFYRMWQLILLVLSFTYMEHLSLEHKIIFGLTDL